MKFHYLTGVMLAVCGLALRPTFAQAPFTWQFSTGVGTQRFADNIDAQLGLGVHASAGRWLAPRLAASFAFDYSSLPFRQRVRAAGTTITNTRDSNVFGLNLSIDCSVAKSALVNPFVKIGGGLENIKVGGADSRLSAAGVAGAGVRIRLQQHIALQVQGDYHLLDSNNLNGFAPQRAPGGYLAARVGFTFLTRREQPQTDDWSTSQLEVGEVEQATPSREDLSAAAVTPDDAATFSSESAAKHDAGSDDLDADLESSTPQVRAASPTTPQAPGAKSNPGEENDDAEDDDTFDFMTLREHGQSSNKKQDLQPEKVQPENVSSPAQSPATPEDFSALEARLQQLEQENGNAPAAEAATAPPVEPPATAPDAEFDSTAFESRLNAVASKYAAPQQGQTRPKAAADLEDLDEEPDDDSSGYKDTLRLLEDESKPPAHDADLLAKPAEANPMAAAPHAAPLGQMHANGVAPAVPLQQTGTFSQGYESALGSFYAGRYAEAEQKMTSLVAAYPSHILASNCYYWIGEARLQSRQPEAAITAFNKVLGFERSLKKDNALLMLGRCYLALKRPQEAREAFNRVLVEYPTSEAVSKAQEYLRSL